MSFEEDGIESTYEEAIEAIYYIMKVPESKMAELFFSITFESKLYNNISIKFHPPEEEDDISSERYYNVDYYISGTRQSNNYYEYNSLKRIFEKYYTQYQGKNIKIDFPIWNGGVNIKPAKKD